MYIQRWGDEPRNKSQDDSEQPPTTYTDASCLSWNNIEDHDTEFQLESWRMNVSST